MSYGKDPLLVWFTSKERIVEQSELIRLLVKCSQDRQAFHRGSWGWVADRRAAS